MTHIYSLNIYFIHVDHSSVHEAKTAADCPETAITFWSEATSSLHVQMYG